MGKRIAPLLLLSFFTACSANLSSSSNTTMTVDYYGVHESTTGNGWDNPLNVERLLLGNSRPLVVLFVNSGNPEASALINQIFAGGWKEKVWIIDTKNSTTQLIKSLMDSRGTSPTLIYMNGQDRTLEENGTARIVKFLEKWNHMLEPITDKQYY